MFNEFAKYIVATAIIIGLFSYVFRKKGIALGSRTVRLALAVIGTLFFLSFLFAIAMFAHIKKGVINYNDAVIPLSILFIAVLFLSIAIFKKDFSDQSKKLLLFKEGVNNAKHKNADIILWILWVPAGVCLAIALKTYSLSFFVLFFMLLLIMFVIRIGRRHW